MIKLENTEVMGWEHAIRGMRNPMNSWAKSDSDICESLQCESCPMFDNEKGLCYAPGKGASHGFVVGPNDHGLMMKLAAGGPVHAKYRRMITVYLDITAPLYWWKEFDTYKVGTVANSCSTMHKIHEKEFELKDFSMEHLVGLGDLGDKCTIRYTKKSATSPLGVLHETIHMLNLCRDNFLETKDKAYWWQMIQLLPSSYNQKRTVMLNYEVLVGIYQHRKNHKLDEWREFCKWIEGLPYSEIITGNQDAE